MPSRPHELQRYRVLAVVRGSRHALTQVGHRRRALRRRLGDHVAVPQAGLVRRRTHRRVRHQHARRTPSARPSPSVTRHELRARHAGCTTPKHERRAPRRQRRRWHRRRSRHLRHRRGARIAMARAGGRAASARAGMLPPAAAPCLGMYSTLISRRIAIRLGTSAIVTGTSQRAAVAPDPHESRACSA